MKRSEAMKQPKQSGARSLAKDRILTMQEPTHEEIAALAHFMWEKDGRPEGHDVERWLLAEAQLRQQLNSNAGSKRA
jgi:hypothetical protein